MTRGRPPSPRSLDPSLLQRMWLAMAVRRRGGRRARVARRALAVTLLLAAGVIAALPAKTQDPGTPVLVLTRDLTTGSVLAPTDLRVAAVPEPPDGALADPQAVAGRTLAAPARRGEVVTDVRLMSASGPGPGPGRVAVPVRPADPAIVDLLEPGTHVAVLTVDDAGVVVALAPDAVVLRIAPLPESGSPDRPVVLAVPAEVADRLAAATLNGSIALRFA